MNVPGIKENAIDETKVAGCTHSSSGPGEPTVRFKVSVRANLGCSQTVVVSRAKDLPPGLHAGLRKLVEGLFTDRLINIFQIEVDQPLPLIVFATSSGSDRAFLDFATSFCAISHEISGDSHIAQRVDNLKDAPQHIMHALETIL